MAEKTAEVTKETAAAAKPAKVVVEIVRGQMPAPIVNMIKKEDSAITDGALAAKFRTTNGKISDIRKNRNFGYIDDTYTPTADEIEKAKAWAANHGGKEIIDAVNAMVPGSDEARKVYEETKASFRAAAKAKKDSAKPAKAVKADAKTEAPADSEKVAEKPVKAGKDAKLSEKDMKDLTA